LENKGYKVDSENEKFMNMPIGKILHDGDEFVFKCSSFDRWVTVSIIFHLEDIPDFTFSVKNEMRIAGYFQNSYFYLILTKLIINIWNENIRDLVGKEDYYTITNLKFKNKKIVNDVFDHGRIIRF